MSIRTGLLRACLVVGGALVSASLTPLHAQTPGQALDTSWTAVCAAAEPDSAFFQRCTEILNAGPGSVDRRSAAAQGNNLGTVASQGRMADPTTGDAGRIDWAASGLFLAVTTRDYDHADRDAEAGYDGSAVGLIVGLDHRLGDRHVIGLALNHQRERAAFGLGSGRIDSRHTGVIATYGGSFDAFGIDAYAGRLRGNLDITRRVDYRLLLDAGTASERSVRVQDLAEADSDASRTIAGVGGSWNMLAGTWQWQLGAGIDQVRSRIDAYVETGGAGLALAVDRQQVTSRQGRLGLRAIRTGSTLFGVLQPYAGFDAYREFADDARALQVAFAGDPDRTPVRFATNRPDADWAEATIGVAATLVGGTAAFIEYRQRLGHRWLDERALSFGLRVEFD